jgi:hypothetical protein
MGSARDSAPDPGRASSSVRPPLTTRRSRPPVSAGKPGGSFSPEATLTASSASNLINLPSSNCRIAGIEDMYE